MNKQHRQMTDIAYRDAQHIDRQIDMLLKRRPIVRANAAYWRAFCRTVISGLDIIQKVVHEQTPNAPQ